ncbi:histidine kinase [Thiorhodococcus mannitoliphagus]|uniref:Histidine kinase n=1 Tax=Thiorhodococcus mannitoliphagus TaxID=329406 RepID=A0A6P1DYG5_9GAMM|nr:FIST C-terminal domain-containing protein [Thiorhodococcus mannitoliphagus]NEX20615.1 histidine kinase [Thiorhodococcus mannitoliphagus]
MSQFRYGHAAGADWREAVVDCLTQIGQVPDRANLGILYATDAVADDLEDLLSLVRASTGIEQWVGTLGGGICATGAEYYEQPAVALMLAELAEDAFRVFTVPNGDMTQFDVVNGSWIADRQPFIGLVHGDPAHEAIEDLVRALAQSTTTGFLVGGLGSPRGAGQSIANRSTQDPLSGVLFMDSVAMTTALTQGCSPMGPTRAITDCQRNILIEIDDRSALEAMREDVGEELVSDLPGLAGKVFAGLPIRGSDTGDYIVRNLVGVDPSHGLLAIAELVEAGQQIVFCRRDAGTAEEDLDRMLAAIKRRLSGPPRGGIYVSCLGRGVNLFGPDAAELKQIQRTLGDFPLIGFYANGEISQDRIYGYTGVLTLFL